MYLIFDTETTGLPQNWKAPLTNFDNWPSLVQLAWQVHDIEGKLMEAKNYIVKPEGFDIPYNASKIHGISTQRAEKEGMPLVEVLEIFMQPFFPFEESGYNASVGEVLSKVLCSLKIIVFPLSEILFRADPKNSFWGV